MTTETDMFAEESKRKSWLDETVAYPHGLNWARILASALESALDDDDAYVMRGHQAGADAFFAMMDELKRIAAAEPSARCYLARVLRKLHEELLVGAGRAVAPEWLDELRELARDNVGNEGVTTEFAIALADEVDDLVQNDEVQAAAALLPELSFERTGYAETSDSIAAQVRALAAVYRVLRSPELLADMRSLAGSGSPTSRVRLALVLAEDNDPECASVLSALVEELEWPGSCALCGADINGVSGCR